MPRLRCSSSLPGLRTCWPVAHDDRGPGVLTHRERRRGDVRVLEQIERDELVVVARLRVVEDVPQLLQVSRPQIVRDVVSPSRRAGSAPRGDLEEPCPSGPATTRRPRSSGAGTVSRRRRSAAGRSRRSRPWWSSQVVEQISGPVIGVVRSAWWGRGGGHVRARRDSGHRRWHSRR